MDVDDDWVLDVAGMSAGHVTPRGTIVARAADARDAGALCSIYRRSVEGVPHGFLPTEGEFAAALGGPTRHVHHAGIVATEIDGRITGFGRYGVAAQTELLTFALPGQGVLFGPFVCPGDVRSAVGVVGAAEDALRELGSSLCCAYDPSEGSNVRFYNGGFCGLSERMPTVLRALSMAGFRVRHRELCLTLDDLFIAKPENDHNGYRFEPVRVGDHGHAVVARRSGSEVGRCSFCRMYPTRTSDSAGARVAYVGGLGVNQPHRARGVGRLLMNHAIHEAQQLGCDTMWLTTGAVNYTAQNLYYSLGFRLVDTCVTLTRPTGQTARDRVDALARAGVGILDWIRGIGERP